MDSWWGDKGKRVMLIRKRSGKTLDNGKLKFYNPAQVN
jgi:hypothetical protein